MAKLWETTTIFKVSFEFPGAIEILWAGTSVWFVGAARSDGYGLVNDGGVKRILNIFRGKVEK